MSNEIKMTPVGYALREALSIIMEPILNLLENDPHSWSKRPCPTCRTISSMIGRPFGCEAKQLTDTKEK